MKIKDLKFDKTALFDPSVLHSSQTSLGIITVLDRLKVVDYQCIETRFLDNEGDWWVTSGNFDIRTYPDLTIEEAIELIKRRANN